MTTREDEVDALTIVIRALVMIGEETARDLARAVLDAGYRRVSVGPALPEDAATKRERITRVPLTIVSTLDGARTDGVLVGVLAHDLDAFEAWALDSRVGVPETSAEDEENVR